MVATQWLTNLAGTGFTPAGIIDLTRPHTPYSLVCIRLVMLYVSVLCHGQYAPLTPHRIYELFDLFRFPLQLQNIGCSLDR
jgi:hypothetical protein